MKSKKLLLVFLSLILAVGLASCDMLFDCNFGEEWKYDETGHWQECECGEKRGEGAHTFGEWNLTENGDKTRVCSVCGYEETQKSTEHQHSYSDKWSKDGEYHWHACNGCNVPADKAEHTYGKCTDTACSVCGTTRESGEHSYDDCTDTSCNSCDDLREAPGHSYIADVTPPTCEADGYITYTCVCGDSYTEDGDAALDHVDADKDHVCDRDGCGEAMGTHEDLNGDHVCDYECNEAIGVHADGDDEGHACDYEGCTKPVEGEVCYGGTATCVKKAVCEECGQEYGELGDHAYESITAVWSDDNSTCTVSVVCKNDETHVSVSETATVSTVVLNVTATKVTYIYNVEFENESISAQTQSVESDVALVDSIATINAPAIKDRVASHDYVKFDLQNAEENQEFTIYYSELDVWDGVSVSESLSGSGTEEDPYLVESGADLAYIDANMTAIENFGGVYFKLTKSIDLGGYSVKLGEYPGWGGRKIFSGIFDGNNCSIRNLNMTESGKGAGLFSVVSGTVKNLSVYGSVTGNDLMTGGIVGWLYNGTLDNCTNYVNVTSTGTAETGAVVGTCQNGTMSGCVNYGSVTGIDSVGGLAGKASGTLTGCINYGAVNGCSDINGIYGSVHSSGTPTVENCIDLGTVKAHNLTYHEAKSNSCEEDGNLEYWACSVCKKNYDADGKAISSVVIAATGHAWDNGVVSEDIIIFTCGNCGNTKQENAVYTVTVNHLYLDGTVAADAEAFEYAYNDTYTVNAKAIEGYAASHDYVKGTVIANTTVTIYYSEVDIWDGTTVSTSLSGSGTEADPYLIQSGADLAFFANTVNEHTVEGTITVATNRYTVFNGVYFKLTKSIDLNGNYLRIGYSLAWNNYSRFGGIFDGNNCSVRGLNIDTGTDKNAALFGMVIGTVKNLSVYGEVYGGNVLNGGITGYLAGGTIDNCTSYVNIEGSNETGGIVGYMSDGTITDCTNYGKVSCAGISAGVIYGKKDKGTVTNCVSFTELNAE